MNTAQTDLLDSLARNSLKSVNFYCAASDALSVQIVGNFNQWQPVGMKRTLDGWWFIRLQLDHGYYHYRFIVDGVPQLDPTATGVVFDQHHEQASLIAVS